MKWPPSLKAFHLWIDLHISTYYGGGQILLYPFRRWGNWNWELWRLAQAGKNDSHMKTLKALAVIIITVVQFSWHNFFQAGYYWYLGPDNSWLWRPCPEYWRMFSSFLDLYPYWRRKWQPTPVFLPEESQGRESLVGCCLWGRTELDMTEVT